MRMPIADILWLMRLKSQETLAHYLQEVTALNVLYSLPESAKKKISDAGACLPILLPQTHPRTPDHPPAASVKGGSSGIHHPDC